MSDIDNTADATRKTSADTNTHNETRSSSTEQFANRAAGTKNTPQATQQASEAGGAPAANTPCLLTLADSSAGAVVTGTSDDLEQAWSSTLDNDLFDSMFTQDWSQLGADSATGEGPTIEAQSYNSLGTDASDLSIRQLGSLESSVSTFCMPVGEDGPRPHAWPFERSGMEEEGYCVQGGRFGVQRGSSNSSLSDGGLSIGTVVASLLYSFGQESGQRTSDAQQCECPRLLSQLVQFTTRSSMLSGSMDPALDLLFAMEQVTLSTKEAISKCTNCDLSSPYIALIICATMDWILENIGSHLRDGSFLDEGRVSSAGTGGRGRLGSCHPDEGPAPGFSARKSPYVLCVGQLLLPKEVSRACIVELLKLRLQRLVQTVKEIVLISRKNKKTLSDLVRCAAKDVCQKAEAMFGMIDL